MLPFISNASILKSLERLSTLNGVRLTPTYRAFFISLYALFNECATFDDVKGKYFLQYSCKEFSNLLPFSFKMVCLSLQSLHDCGALERVPSPHTFKRLANGDYVTNKPYLTYLNLDFLISD